MNQKIRRVRVTGVEWARRRWWVLVGGLIVGVIGIGVALTVELARQTQDLMAIISGSSDLVSKDRADLIRNALQYQSDTLTKLWTGIVQAVGAVVLAVGAIATWRNLRLTQQTLKITQDKLEVDREAQITNRFTQAIAQLGAELKDGTPNLETRLGAIYALERIARESPDDHWPIMQVLSAYVRLN